MIQDPLTEWPDDDPDGTSRWGWLPVAAVILLAVIAVVWRVCCRHAGS